MGEVGRVSCCPMRSMAQGMPGMPWTHRTCQCSDQRSDPLPAKIKTVSNHQNPRSRKASTRRARHIQAGHAGEIMAGRAPDPLLDRLLAPDDGRDGHDVDPAVPPNAPNPGDGHRDRRPGGPGHANAGDGHRRGRPGGPGRPGPGRCHANASSSYSGSWASNVSFAEAFPDVDVDLTHLGARHNVSIPNPHALPAPASPLFNG